MIIFILTLLHRILLISARPPSEVNSSSHNFSGLFVFSDLIYSSGTLCSPAWVNILCLVLPISMTKVLGDSILIEKQNTLEVLNRMLSTYKHVIDALFDFR